MNTNKKVIEKLKKLLGKNSNIREEYGSYMSHYHCWHQNQPPACGIPLEKHKQCCLCDTLVPSKQEEKCCEKCTHPEFNLNCLKSYTCNCHSSKPEEEQIFTEEDFIKAEDFTHTSDEWIEELRKIKLPDLKEETLYGYSKFEERLVTFISSLLFTAIKTREEELLQAIKEMIPEEDGNFKYLSEDVKEFARQLKVKLDELINK